MRGEAERRKGELRGRGGMTTRGRMTSSLSLGESSLVVSFAASARGGRGAKRRERVPSTDEDGVDAGCAVAGVEPGAEGWVTVDERGVASLADVGARARRFAKKREVVPSTV